MPLNKPYPNEVERGRLLTGRYPTEPGDAWGMFILKTEGLEKLRVLVGDGAFLAENGKPPWNHVSVSVIPAFGKVVERLPTWQEMDRVKRLFFTPDTIAVQIHPAEDRHVSFSEVLHLWELEGHTFPTPPLWTIVPTVEE